MKFVIRMYPQIAIKLTVRSERRHCTEWMTLNADLYIIPNDVCMSEAMLKSRHTHSHTEKKNLREKRLTLNEAKASICLCSAYRSVLYAAVSSSVRFIHRYCAAWSTYTYLDTSGRTVLYSRVYRNEISYTEQTNTHKLIFCRNFKF